MKAEHKEIILYEFWKVTVDKTGVARSHSQMFSK